MGERWKRIQDYVRTQFLAWGIWTLFSLAVTGIVWAFTAMPWYSILLVLICLVVAIATGIKGIQLVSQDMRSPEVLRQLRHAEKMAKREDDRLKATRKLFRELAAKGEVSVPWSTQQTEDWLAEVEYTMRPLLGPNEVSNFVVDIVRNANISTDQKRLRATAWLKAVRIKFWVH
jgi:hypothetical protein